MNAINILLIEDSSSDALLLHATLTRDCMFSHQLTRAERLKDGLALMAQQSFDLVLTDLGLPDSHGLATVAELQKAAPRVPIIVLTRQDDMETAVAAIKQGAQDYLPKSEIDGFVLCRTIQYAIERKQLMRQLEDALAEVKTLSGMLPICGSCKKVRDDKGYWNQIERYIMQRSDATFSHGFCPECLVKLYEEGGIPVPQHLRDAMGQQKQL